jgi:hypothetical protein
MLAYPMFFAYVHLRSIITRFTEMHIVLLSYCLILLTTVVLYVLACDPLPPCAGRLWVWLGKSAPLRLASSESSPPTTRSARTRRG